MSTTCTDERLGLVVAPNKLDKEVLPLVRLIEERSKGMLRYDYAYNDDLTVTIYADDETAAQVWFEMITKGNLHTAFSLVGLDQ